MIKNERQYRITKAQAANFRRALSELAQQKASPSSDSLKLELLEASFESQVQELEAEIREYESTRSNNSGLIEVHSLYELPRALIKARIASGLSQAELASRLGLKEQQVQRYEATDYAGVSIERIQKVIDALGVTIRNKLFLPTKNVSLGSLFKKLSTAGLDRSFVERRLVPAHLRPLLHQSAPADESKRETLALQVASAVGRVFNWTPDLIFGEPSLGLDSSILASARFKLPLQASEARVSAYTVYAHYLALLTLECTPSLIQRSIPLETKKVYQEITERHGRLDLRSVITYVWSLGVPVLPLSDAGAFHGACWRVGGRSIIVVKQRNVSHARWIVDILHELYHVGRSAEEHEFSHIEPADIFSPDAEAIQEEHAATQFAVDITLSGRAEELVDRCVTAARGKVEWLKRALPDVAEEGGVDASMLANYLAHRLSMQNINWWPTAAKFQLTNPSAWEVTRDILLQHLDVEQLGDPDRSLLTQALTD